MQYMLMLYEDEAVYGGPEKDGPALKAVAARHWDYVKELGAARITGAGLKGSAFTTTVRTTDGRQPSTTGRSPRRASSSAASTSSRRPISTPPSPWPGVCR
ncbi:hypothetical protein [Chelatococcus reniformis]|nr:hypothetical protein [Chelatococcus reniformis]